MAVATISISIDVVVVSAQVGLPVTRQDKSSSQMPRSRFRYLIVLNGPLHDGRLVQVLMDAQTFSEVNLKELFNLVAKRFPEPEELHVGVFTSLKQLPTPEEQDYALSTHTDSLPFMEDIDKYPGAVYTRVDGQ